MPKSPAAAALACVGVFLVLWPLTLQRPGLPYSFKADEPAYYLMARSLWEDGDLRCERRDLLRVREEVLHKTENLILMSLDRWRTTYFGKPYVGSLIAAPAVAAFGIGGWYALNAALLVASIWMGWAFLRRRNGEGEALLYSCGFFLVSAGFAYVFWMQLEVLSLASVTAAAFFSLHEFAPAEPGAGRARRVAAGLVAGSGRWLLAGLAVTPAAIAKPFYALALLPGAIGCLQARRPRHLAAMGLAAALGAGALSWGQHRLTGVWSPYVGPMLRRAFVVADPNFEPWRPVAEMYAEEARQREAASARGERAPQSELDRLGKGVRGEAGVWWWAFRWPIPRPDRIVQDTRNFLVGRHTGALPWFPFLGVSLLLFATGGGARDPRRWGVLVAFLALAAFSILWNLDNYHGGRGFVGNRYLVGLYPLALFLVDRIRPRAATLLGFVAGALFLGQVVFAPLGPPVDEPTLQAYARAEPFRWLPFEYQMNNTIPGQRYLTQADAVLLGRRDRLQEEGEWATVIGRGEVEVLFMRRTPARNATFLLRNWAPGNEVELASGAGRQRIRFPDADPPPGGHAALVRLDLGEPDERFTKYKWGRPELVWKLRVRAARAASPRWWGAADDDALVGVRLLHIGDAARLGLDVYAAEVQTLEAPATAVAGQVFGACARVRNASEVIWTQDSAARVKLAYRWRTLAGEPVPAPEIRGELPFDVDPGWEVEVDLRIHAPSEPGDYVLVVEPVFEYVRWFGDVRPEARFERTMRVLPAPR